MNPTSGATPFKQANLRKFLNYQMDNAYKHAKRVVFVDACPGVGVGSDGAAGSPLIFLEYMLALKERGIDSLYVCCDWGEVNSSQNKKAGVPYVEIIRQYFRLAGMEKQFIGLKGDSSKVLVDGDPGVGFPGCSLWEKDVGVVYVDPCGSFPMGSIAEMVGNAKGMDVVVNMSAKDHARHAQYNTVGDMLRSSDKYQRYWRITDPVCGPQWVMFIGTVRSDFPGAVKIGAYTIYSGQGKAIYEQLFCIVYNKTPCGVRAKKGVETRRKRSDLKVRIVEMKSRGLTNAVIAKTLGVSAAFVGAVLKEEQT